VNVLRGDRHVIEQLGVSEFVVTGRRARRADRDKALIAEKHVDLRPVHGSDGIGFRGLTGGVVKNGELAEYRPSGTTAGEHDPGDTVRAHSAGGLDLGDRRHHLAGDSRSQIIQVGPCSHGHCTFAHRPLSCAENGRGEVMASLGVLTRGRPCSALPKARSGSR
jgi:hypothetical protein